MKEHGHNGKPFLIVSTLLLMSKLYFKTPGASNRSSYSRTVSTDNNYPRSCPKLVAETATTFTLGKRSEDFTTDVKATGHNIKWAILTMKFWRPARLTTTVKGDLVYSRVTASIECQCQQ